MTADEPREQHWDRAYALGDTTRSWYQRTPELSLRMLETAGVNADDSILDVGGGASTLADTLLERGFSGVSVLDVSHVALDHARDRLGANASRIEWMHADLLEWQPPRVYQVWHDRAVFHFLTDENDRARYLATLARATSTGSIAVIGCFAPDGPEYCSGLPVTRYDSTALAAELGAEWQLVADDREEHRTPADALQPFTWAALRRS